MKREGHREEERGPRSFADRFGSWKSIEEGQLGFFPSFFGSTRSIRYYLIPKLLLIIG